MYKKLCILLMGKYHTHKLYAIFAKFLNICKQVAGNFVNESGNVPRKGVVQSPTANATLRNIFEKTQFRSIKL